MDESQLVARELGIERATDVVIVDPAALQLVFRGALNDRWAKDSRSRRASEHYLADALRQFLAGETVTARKPHREAPDHSGSRRRCFIRQ